MLQLDDYTILSVDDYCILHREDGLDRLEAVISQDDPGYRLIQEHSRLLETSEQQYYRVEKLRAYADHVRISCVLDLEDWQRTCLLSYTNNNQSLSGTLLGVVPSGWTVNNLVSTTAQRLIEMDGPTPLEVVQECRFRFGCAVRFYNQAKQLVLLQPQSQSCTDAFFTDELNLRELPLLRADCEGLVTRLYVMGKNGLTVDSVNRGKSYVENFDYTQDIICGFWKDTRYDNAVSLRDDAQARVNALANPERQWQLKVYDLYRMNPVRWAEHQVGMFSVLKLADRSRQEQMVVQVIGEKLYPHHPERNEITVTTSRNRAAIYRALPKVLDNPNSAFYQKLNAR